MLEFSEEVAIIQRSSAAARDEDTNSRRERRLGPPSEGLYECEVRDHMLQTNRGR